MTAVYDAHGIRVYHGDCLDVLRELPDNSVDAICTDPPYGLEFMGKDWDSFRYSNSGPAHTDFKNLGPLPTYSPNRRNQKCPKCGKWAYDHPGRKCECGGWKQPAQRNYSAAYQQWCQQWATECLRVAKPGAHLLAFGGTRTWHRLCCAIEDAGWEIRDSITWVYGSGFPKSLDVSKAIDKAPATSTSGAPLGVLDPRPNSVNNYERAGFTTTPATDDARRWQGWGTALKPAHEPIVVARKPLAGTVAQNVLAYGTGGLNIDGCRVDASDATSGRVQHGGGTNNVYAHDEWTDTHQATMGGPMPAGRWPPNLLLTHAESCQPGRCDDGCPVAEMDAGSASQFFPTFRYTPKADTAERVRGDVPHPTVKPLNLMRWLVRLVTPPDGIVLDCFAGSGTTGEAALLEGFQAILIEREADYLPLIRQRITRRRDPVQHLRDAGGDLGLFEVGP